MILQNFINELGKTFLKNDMLSIDIGYTNMKIIHSRKKAGTALKVLNFGIGGTPAGCIRNGVISDLDGIAGNLKKIIDAHGITEKDVKIVISAGSNIVSRIIPVPRTSQRKIEESVREELGRQLPVDIRTHKLFFRITGNGPGSMDDRYRVLVTIVPNSTIDNYSRLVKCLGFKPLAVEIPFSSVARFFSKGVRIRDMNGIGWTKTSLDIDKSSAAVVDLGSETTNMSILNNGALEFNRIILTGGRNLDARISRLLGVDEGTAERYKVMYGLAAREEPDNRVGRVVGACLREDIGEIMNNIKRSMEFYSTRCGGKPVERIIFIGGGSGLKGLREYAECLTGITAYTIETLELKNVEFAEDLDRDKIRYLVSALGIAM